MLNFARKRGNDWQSFWDVQCTTSLKITTHMDQQELVSCIIGETMPCRVLLLLKGVQQTLQRQSAGMLSLSYES
eukprot:2449999-Amphidinium_carterae.1